MGNLLQVELTAPTCAIPQRPRQLSLQQTLIRTRRQQPLPLCLPPENLKQLPKPLLHRYFLIKVSLSIFLIDLRLTRPSKVYHATHRTTPTNAHCAGRKRNRHATPLEQSLELYVWTAGDGSIASAYAGSATRLCIEKRTLSASAGASGTGAVLLASFAA